MTKSHHKRPGHSARQIAKRRRLNRMLIALSAFMLMLLSLTFIPREYSGLDYWMILMGILVLALTVDHIVNSAIHKSQRWERKALRGAVAEEEVGTLLEQLPEPRAIFHDVDTGHGDIDHIVLSPQHGVILIETKSHHGTVEVENDILLVKGYPPENDFITQTIRNTRMLELRIRTMTGIEVWIQPIIVFTNAFVREWRPIHGVRLRNKKYLLKAVGETSVIPAVASQLWTLHEQGKPIW